MRRKTHYVIQPTHLWNSIANLARTQNGELLNTLQAGFKYIETESFESTFQGLFSEIDLSSPKLGKKYEDRNAKLCSIIAESAKGLADFSTDIDALGDAYEYLIGQFAAGSGKKAGEFYTPQQISDILSAIVTLDSQEPKTGTKKRLESVLDLACRCCLETCLIILLPEPPRSIPSSDTMPAAGDALQDLKIRFHPGADATTIRHQRFSPTSSARRHFRGDYYPRAASFGQRAGTGDMAVPARGAWGILVGGDQA